MVDIRTSIKENIILESKVARSILLYLGKKQADYVHHTAKEVGFSWASSSRHFTSLEKKGLVELIDKKDEKKYLFIHMNKRTKYYRLTEKGKIIAELLMKLNQEVNK